MGCCGSLGHGRRARRSLRSRRTRTQAPQDTCKYHSAIHRPKYSGRRLPNAKMLSQVRAFTWSPLRRGEGGAEWT
jgi:hypothetical protein